jgi:hypothetical protein
MQIDDYCDLAKQRNALKSDRELTRRLGLVGSAISHWRTKRTWPSDKTMIELAELAGEDPRVGLLDLNLWRSESAPVRLAYERIRNALAAAAAIAIVAVSTLASPAQAAPETALDILWEIILHAANALSSKARRLFYHTANAVRTPHLASP